MKSFLLLIFSINLSLSAQVSNSFYGLARSNSPAFAVHLAVINPATGVVTNISPASVSPLFNLTGAALDPYRNTYHFIGNDDIKTINLTTGLQTTAAVINNPLGSSYFDNFRFNNSDSTLYGLARRTTVDSSTNIASGELYLATINVSTGTITQISTASIGKVFALAGSAIDPYKKVYYYSTGSHFVGLDMYDGTVYSTAAINISNGDYFDNFTYNCVDTSIYGLIRKNFYDTIVSPIHPSQQLIVLDSSATFLGKINPSTGVVTTISPTSLDKVYTLNGSSAIDPVSMTYYYNNGDHLVGVSLRTGLKISEPLITNSNGQYFDMIRIQSTCYEATRPKRIKPTAAPVVSTNESSILIAPNPATNMVNIAYSAVIKSIELINVSGNILVSKTINASSYSLNISSLNPGVYFFKCYCGEKVIIKRIVKR